MFYLNKRKIGYYKGHTTNYILVNAKGKSLENKIKKVKIIKKNNLELYGEIICDNASALSQ